jgi:hypothetical protein
MQTTVTSQIVAQRLEWMRQNVEVAEAVMRDGNHDTALKLLTKLTKDADDARAQLVTELRSEGWSWAAIGALVGVSKQGAQQRYGR